MAKSRKKFDVGRNVQQTFEKDNLMSYLEVLGTAIYSIASPTILKMQGWGAFAVAYGVPFLAGAILNRQSVVKTSLAGAVLHAGFYLADENLKDSKGTIKSTWGIGGQTALNDVPQAQLPAGVQMVNMGNRQLLVEPRTNLNDYVRKDEPVAFLNDHISEINFSESPININSAI